MKLLLSWLATAIIICLAIHLAHMPPTVVFHGSALLLVLSPQLIFLLNEYGSGILGFISRLGRTNATEADQTNLVKLAALGALFSAFGYTLGIIQIMRNLGSVDRIGPGVAFCLMSALYSAITPILFFHSFPPERLKAIAGAVAAYILMATSIVLALTFAAIHTLK